MSETMEQTGNATEAPKPKKAPPEKKPVLMNDGRTVIFTGKQRMLKSTSTEGTQVTTRFDFVNGETRSYSIDLTDALAPKFVGHGIEQKVGDETAGDESVDDMVVHVDNILGRLAKGEWGAERGSGDGFAGASTVMKALMEVTGKDMAWVKDFLEKKLKAAADAGQTLTRQKLYAAFRAPGTKTAPIIQRIEAEKAAKSAKEGGIDADAALEEAMAAD